MKCRLKYRARKPFADARNGVTPSPYVQYLQQLHTSDFRPQTLESTILRILIFFLSIIQNLQLLYFFLLFEWSCCLCNYYICFYFCFVYVYVQPIFRVNMYEEENTNVVIFLGSLCSIDKYYCKIRKGRQPTRLQSN